MNDDWQDALPPHARNVIASAELDDCDEATFERMQNKVRAAVVVAGVTAGAAGASAAAAKGAAAEGAAAGVAGAAALKGAVSLKLLGTFVLGAALVGGVTWTASQDGAETHGQAAQEAEAESRVEAESTEAESQEAEQEAESQEANVEPTTTGSETGAEPAEPSSAEMRLEPEAGPALPAVRTRERRPREPRAETRSPSGGAETNRTEEPAPPGTFVDELRLLRELRQAAQNTPTRALALAREHRARFAGSGLAPERDVYRIQALVRLNRREDAGAAAAAFHRRFPGSAYAARVDALLQD